MKFGTSKLYIVLRQSVSSFYRRLACFEAQTRIPSGIAAVPSSRRKRHRRSEPCRWQHNRSQTEASRRRGHRLRQLDQKKKRLAYLKKCYAVNNIPSCLEMSQEEIFRRRVRHILTILYQ